MPPPPPPPPPIAEAAGLLAASLGLGAPASSPAAAPPAPRSLRSSRAAARWTVARDVLAVASGVRPFASLDGAFLPDPRAAAAWLGAALLPLAGAAAAAAAAPHPGDKKLALVVVDGVCCVCSPSRLLREGAARLEALRRRGPQTAAGAKEPSREGALAPLLVRLGEGGARLLSPEEHARACAQLEALHSVLEDAFERAAAASGAGGAPSLPVVPDLLLLPLPASGAPRSGLPALPTLNGWLLGYPVVYTVDDAGGDAEAAGRAASAALREAAGSPGGGLRLLLAGHHGCPPLPPLGPSGGGEPPLWQCSVPVGAVGGIEAVRDVVAAAAERELRGRLRERQAEEEAAGRHWWWGSPDAARVEVAPAPDGAGVVL
jgi:hypothetical protein